MGKRNNTKKSVQEVMAEAQAITDTGPIDHHTQSSSWTAVDTTPEVIEENVLESVEQELEVQEVQAEGNEVITEPATDEPILTTSEEPEGEQIVTFDQIIAALDPTTVDETVVMLAEEIDDRVEFEERVAPDNDSIQKTLKKVRAQFTASKDAARVLLATQTSTDFINRSISDGARYNVYALGKLADIVRGLSEGTIGNAINNACMRSLFACRAAGVPFTSLAAKAAASDKIRDIDPAVKKHLVRHTVSASTAPTQASSTMQALETLGLVTRTGSRRDSVWTLTDHPAVDRIAEKLGIAA